MKQLLTLVAAYGIGYLLVVKGLPYIQAKIETMDLDQMWEVWNEVD